MFKSRLPLVWAIKETREHRRITQEEVEIATGITQPTLSAWLNYKPMAHLNAKVAARLCRYFGCSLCDLVELDDIGEDASMEHPVAV